MNQSSAKAKNTKVLRAKDQVFIKHNNFSGSLNVEC
jgi:hypothetical protein